MPVLNVQVVNHTLPAVSVTIAGSSGLTYSELKNSLGTQVYRVDDIYLYSDQTSQLIRAIKYNSYNVNGNEVITNIATVVDPNQSVNSLMVGLGDTFVPIILNGQSSLSTTILPFTLFQIKLLAERVTNSFGRNLSNFQEMEKITNTKFFHNYGADTDLIQESNFELMESISNPLKELSGGDVLSSKNVTPVKNDYTGYVLLGGAAAAIIYLLVKNKK